MGGYSQQCSCGKWFTNPGAFGDHKKQCTKAAGGAPAIAAEIARLKEDIAERATWGGPDPSARQTADMVVRVAALEWALEQLYA